MPELFEVRVLGSFRVRTEDGRVVDPRAWRTTKTRDLVRLLAVAGKVVPVDRIVDALWPDAEPSRGRASLRTAASQIRQVIGEEHLARREGGFELTGAWVDATAFAVAVSDARHRLAAGDRADGVAAAWEAVRLYSGDLCEDEPYAEWLVPDRERLRALHRQVLVEAAEAAVELGWLRDGAELGHRALVIDRTAERAYRSLMRVYGRLGETERALRLYEQCRRSLADELGVDPGEATQAVHLELLRPEVQVEPAVPFVGRERWLEQARAAMDLALEESRPATVLVTGVAGVGRSRFLEQAASHWAHRVLRVPCRATGAPGSGGVSGELAQSLGGGPADGAATASLSRLLGTQPTLLLLDDVQWADGRSLRLLADLVHEHDAPLVVLAGLRGHLPVEHPLATAHASTAVELPSLSTEEVAELLALLLMGPPASTLVDEITSASGGVTSEVVSSARQLLADGNVLSTAEGMVRVPRSRDESAHVETRLARARDLVDGVSGELLDLLAVLDRPTPAAELARLSDVEPCAVRAALDRLCDLRLVVQLPGGFCFVDRLVREAAYLWLRPTARRNLHRRVAESARLPSAERVDHWVRGGDPRLGCAAALEAADEALARGDLVHARGHLRLVRAYADENEIDVDERIALCERLAEVSHRTGRRWEAHDLCERAIALARSEAPQALPRLHRLLGRYSDRGAALRAYAAATSQSGVTGEERRRSLLATAAVTTGASPAQATLLLERAVVEADAAQDVESQIEARVLLARATNERRQFDRAQHTAREAMALAETVGTPAQWVRSAHVLVRTGIFLGDGRRQLELLRRVRERSLSCGDPAQVHDVALTHALVLHDLADPEFHTTWPRVREATAEGSHALLQRLLDSHISLERGQLGRSARLLDELAGPPEAVVASDAVDLLRARLLLAEDPQHVRAAELLRGVLAHRESGPSLFGPEAAARLAVLLAGADPESARRCLDLALELAGLHLHPRERVCLLQGRAALLARSDPQGAATVALAAARSARRAGLVLYEAAAHDQRAELLTAAGQQGRARADVERALELRAAAGAVGASERHADGSGGGLLIPGPRTSVRPVAADDPRP